MYMAVITRITLRRTKMSQPFFRPWMHPYVYGVFNAYQHVPLRPQLDWFENPTAYFKGVP